MAIRQKQKVKPSPKSSYRFGQIVWCKFGEVPAAIPPEFVGEHPAVIVSTSNRMGLPHLVVPMTSQRPSDCDDPSVVVLTKGPIKSRETSYVIGSHIYSVSNVRLRMAGTKGVKLHFPKDRIGELIDAINSRLPQKRDGQK